MSNSNWSTRFLDVKAIRDLIQRVGIRSMIRQMFEAMREDYIRWEDFQKSARLAAHSDKGVVELMPISDDKLFSYKYVNGHPANPLVGLPTVMAYGALADMETGFPILLSEMTILTAVRTATASALAASVLARKDSTTMALIGNGAQAEFQILAFSEMLSINQIRLFDVDRSASDKVVGNLAGFPEIVCTVCGSLEEAIQGADIITTCTAAKARQVVLSLQDVAPGVHLNAIGGDCPGKTELDVEVLANALVVVQYEPQTRIEGEIQAVPADFHVTELWSILAGKAPGRHSADEVTIFDSVGFSLEDLSALRTVYRLAKENEIGAVVDLIPDLADVKDLFSQLV